MATTAPYERHFGIPPRLAEDQVARDQTALPNQVFQPLPAPTGPAPYRLDLASVLPAAAMSSIEGSGRMVFHCVGDTGGIKDPQPQVSVIDAMLADMAGANAPAFFYHLGDVVYFNGQKAQYFSQFYEPYEHYNVPIFAIPGNHDGDAINAAVEPSLAGFVENFCATQPHFTPESQDSQRDAMTQPNVYWTLLTPLATFIGLYSNCPDGGVIKPDQAAWLESELAAAPAAQPVFVSLHHPIFSADSVHGGNMNLAQLLDDAIQKSGRIPDAVFTGHVHNYQRFTRTHSGRQVPYIVAGAGGYHNLHNIALTKGGGPPQLPWTVPSPYADTQLVKYCDDHFGFMRITLTAKTMQVDYIQVSPAPVAAGGDPQWSTLETFTVDLEAHTVS